MTFSQKSEKGQKCVTMISENYAFPNVVATCLKSLDK